MEVRLIVVRSIDLLVGQSGRGVVHTHTANCILCLCVLRVKKRSKVTCVLSCVVSSQTKCFICGIGSDYFDTTPHGFETHTFDEHNLANYMSVYFSLLLWQLRRNVQRYVQ